MAKLRLLGGPEENFPYLIIDSETDAERLKREAMLAHDAWLCDNTAAKRQTFAVALKVWGRAAHNREAQEYADRLYRGDVAGLEATGQQPSS